MKRISMLAAIAASILPVAAQAQQTDYLGLNDRAELAARVVTSAGSCTQLGFDVSMDGEAAVALGNRTVRQGVMDGINKSTAEQLVLAAMDREREDLAYLSEVPANLDTNEELLAHYRETMGFWLNRCRSLAATQLGGQYIRVTGREDEVFERMMADMAKELDEINPG